MNMKKILLIFATILCATNLLYGSTVTVNAYALGEGNDGAFRGGGTVQVWTASYSGIRWNDYATTGAGVTSTCSSSEYKSKLGISALNKGIKIKLEAQPNDGYYLVGWATSENLNASASGSTPYEPTAPEYKGRDHTINYYAIFKQVQINTVTPESAVLETNDLYKTSDATFVFNVVGVDNLNDVGYSLQPLNEATGFSIVEGPTLNTTDKTITFKVRYKNDGFHNPEGNPERKATLTLSSAPGKNYKSVTITAKSNLQLDFTTNPDGKLNFTPDEPMNQGEERTDTITTTAGTTTANHATWHVAFEDPDMAAMMGYSLVTDPTNKDPQVKFTAPDVNMAGIKTNLIITATYTSTNGIKITKSKTIELSANVGRVITINGYSESDLVFDLDYSNSDTYTTQNAVLYSTLDLDSVTLTPTGFPADNSIKYDWTTGATNIAISAKSNITPGQYKVKLLAEVSDIQATLNIDVNVRLAKPVVTATTGLGNAVLLSWEPIYGASGYVIYSETTQVATTTNTFYNVTEVGGNALDDRNYLFMVKAIYNDDEEHFACRASDEISETPSVAQVIDKNNYSYVEIYTGTDCPSNEFPYKPKQRIDFSSCFDASGNPLFDKLYIFGKTTNTNGVKYTYKGQVYPRINKPTNPDNATTCFNATTPLYVYNKVQGGYQLEQTLDATETRFDHKTSMSGNKIYLTGYCPFAYMGATADEEGWMYFKGGNTSVDIYLEDCEIRGRYKTENGCNRTTGGNYDYADFTLKLEIGNNYMKGCSSPFVFYALKSASFRPNFHIKGNNFLQGQYGMQIKKVKANAYFTEVDLGPNFENKSYACAPISIRVDKESGYTNLIFDDNWADGTITNGYLKLISSMSHVGSLDLGSEAGEATFNGGQYHVRNAAADGNYTTNIMASFRRFSQSVVDGITVSLYGFGGDVPKDCKVTINSGTFTLEKNVNPSAGHAYYRDDVDFMDLRLPGKSVVNGGTFNGITNVVTCVEATTMGKSPVNGENVELCLFNGAEPTGETSYGTKTFRFDHASFDGIKFIDDYYGSANAIATDLRNSSTMQSVILNVLYGAQSLNPDAEGKLNLLLPSVATTTGGNDWCEPFDNTLLRQWATCAPEMKVTNTAGTNSEGVGGDIEILKQIDGVAVATNYLLYMEGDDMMKEVELEVGDMHIKCNANRSNITNTEIYKIQKELHILKPAEADQWMTIVAPFDVHDISILENLNETELQNMTREEAHRAQVKQYLEFSYNIKNMVMPDPQGRTSSHPLTTLMEWYGIKPYKLVHYNDSNNIRDAHYYLYELDNLNDDDSFSTNATGKELNITWKPVATPQEHEPILKKGHVYAMLFPYCPLCSNKDRTTYDYWSGKYIWFYGKGPQTISGSNAQTDMKTSALKLGTAILKGNSTFKNMSLSAGSAYVHNTSNDLFELINTTYSAKPLEAFMLYNPLTARMPKAISRAGKVIYEEQTATGLPTIGDRTTLNAYANNMQIHLTALQAQRAVIYDMHGQVLFDGQLMEGEQMSISAPQGIYIVKGTYEIIKLIVD